MDDSLSPNFLIILALFRLLILNIVSIVDRRIIVHVVIDRRVLRVTLALG